MSGAGNFVDHAKSGNNIPQKCHFNDANEGDVVKVDPANLNGTCGGLLLSRPLLGLSTALSSVLEKCTDSDWGMLSRLARLSPFSGLGLGRWLRI
jgi:hypothetical protein